MKKEMKHALVALGLSTLLVPTFASQVVSAQEESHETASSTTPEEIKKVIAEYKKAQIDFMRKDEKRFLNLVKQIDWSVLSFSQNDINFLNNKISEHFSEDLQYFINYIDIFFSYCYYILHIDASFYILTISHI